MTSTRLPQKTDAVLVSVLRGLAEGLSDREIARRVHISERTVQRLVDQFKARTGAGNRFAAGAAACRLGLLHGEKDPPGPFGHP